MINYIPITYNVILKRNQYANYNTYLFLNYIYYAMEGVDADLDRGRHRNKTVVTYLKPMAVSNLTAQMGISRGS